MSRNRPAARSKSAARRRAAAAAVSVGAGILGTLSAEAGIVTIDISSSGFNFDSVNAGLPLAINSSTSRANFPTSGEGGLFFQNSPLGRGVSGTGGLGFASDAPYTPHNFPGGAAIGSSFDSSGGIWAGADFRTFFRYNGIDTPNFGSDSYLGFQTINGNYGWLKSTWDGTNFQFTSAAYESTPGVAIAAGAVVVPEPSTTALLGLGALALGAGAVRKQRAARRTQAAAAVSA